jgi:teichuronic acid exporter
MSLKQKVLKGILWTAIDKIGVQIVQLILSVLIARVLTPEDYGIVALLYIFIAISNVFIESGFGKALIQDNKPNHIDYSTVFYFNIGISVLFYFGMYFSAPFIAEFYDLPILVKLTRVISITLIINSLIIIPNAIFTIALNFKPLAISKTISTVIGGFVGLITAYNGFGVWALVYMTIVSSLLFAIFQWFQVKWIPSFCFSLNSLKRLYKFGNKLFFGALLDTIVRNLSSVFIGKLFDSKSLGFYSKGTSFANLASNSTLSILYSVLFPAFSSIKNEKEKLLFNFKKSIRYTALAVLPLFMLGSILAKPIIVILLTDKWLISAYILQFLILGRMINMIFLINAQMLQAIGRSDITLKQDIGKMSVKFLLLLLSLKFGIIWIAISELISAIINIFINTYASKKLFNFGALKQFEEISRIFISALISSLIVVIIIYYIDNNYIKIIVATITLFCTYITSLIILKQKDFINFKVLFLNRLKK